jgi:8-oxo-dGTP diphosphatase
MAERDGDGWVNCRCGNKHWGLHGAAGVVLLDPESRSILMQLRAEWTHGGRVWGIPGGAKDSHETAIESALREMSEELSIHPDRVEVIHDNIWADHDDWSYHTVIAIASREIHYQVNEEAELAEWIELNKVSDLNLHPGFASNWDDILNAIEGLLANT